MHHRCSSYPLILLIAAISLTSQPAWSQNNEDLRSENQQLRSQLNQVTSELQAAQDRIAELEAQLVALERALAAARGETIEDPSSDETTIDESEPSASPRALYRALQKDYQQALQDLEPGQVGDRDRTNYMRVLNRWRAGAARQFRAQVQWHVQVEEEFATRSGYDLRLRAVDPVTHVPLGAPFSVSLARTLARHYETLRDNRQIDTYVLRGTLQPQITVNPQRPEAGPFDNPPLIGPFAEFGFTVEPRSLAAPPTESQPTEEE